ncbi:MAG: hypothetical protein A2Y04_00425 [Omnitrophica WOR_2 bacterium GWC2_45_7]|nr:MAG: hypothetical protein A2Y04_00425 [Omnitrophica WOR_2 bacterium GWC2_45_7]
MGFIMIMGNVSWAEEEANDTLAVKSRHIFSSDIDATASDISMTETEFKYAHEFKAGGVLPIEYSFHFGHIDIEDDDPLDLPSHLESRSLGLGVKLPAPLLDQDKFFVGLDIFPTLNTDAWRWESSAFRLPFRSYLIYKESDDFILVGGVSVRPEYDTTVLPVLGVIYKPNDRLSFNLASENPNITYKFNDTTNLIWEFDYKLDEYEVRRSGQQGVVLEYRETSAGFGVEHAFNENVSGLLTVGGVFNRRLEYKDDVGKVIPDSGFYVNAKFTASF